jgi:predicted DNA-binding transcriptional regulator YafY
MKIYNRKLVLYVLILFGFGVSVICSTPPSVADDVTDAIDEGLKKYEAGQ